MKPLITKDNLHKAYKTDEDWEPAEYFKFNDLKEGNIIVTKCGFNYVFAPTDLAGKLVGYKLTTDVDYVFIRQCGRGYRYAILDEIKKTFPESFNNPDINAHVIYTGTKKFKDSNDLKNYIDREVQKYIENLPTIITDIK